MFSGRQKQIKAVALFLIFSLAQVYVQLSLAQTVGAIKNVLQQSQQTVGRLSTRGNRPILVNGNKASTGETILDGALLETSDCVTATVHLPLMGEVDLATNTTATINYSAGRVRVTLKQGCVRVRVEQAIDVVIETPDGKSTTATEPDAANRKRAEVCFPAGVNSDFSPTCIGAPIIIGGILTAGVPLVAGLILGGSRGSSSASCVRGENSSFSTPTDIANQCQ
jgi:hypothetical protein